LLNALRREHSRKGLCEIPGSASALTTHFGAREAGRENRDPSLRFPLGDGQMVAHNSSETAKNDYQQQNDQLPLCRFHLRLKHGITQSANPESDQ
jgi:hypothetical protein